MPLSPNPRKAGIGRRHKEGQKFGGTRTDKQDTTKLERQLKRKSCFPPTKKYPFSTKK